MLSNDGRKRDGWNDGNDGTIIHNCCLNTLIFISSVQLGHNHQWDYAKVLDIMLVYNTSL